MRSFACCLVFSASLFSVALYSQTTNQFTTPEPVTASTNGKLYAVADFNGDGRPDILTSGVVLLQNSNGTFTPKNTGVTFGQVVQVADVNGDGKPDLIMANPGGEDCDPTAPPPNCVDDGNATLMVALNNGDGTFAELPTITLGLGANLPSLVVHDVNGDGKPDIVIATSDNPQQTNTGNGSIQTFFNDGKGNFTAGPVTSAGSAIILAAADFNNDGKIDLLVSQPSSYGNVAPDWEILKGAGNGSFNSVLLTEDGDVDVGSSGDFNHDGRTDVVVAPQNGPALVYLNEGSGDFTKSQSLISQIFGSFDPSSTPQSLVVAEFNHDGSLDLALSYADLNTPQGPSYAAIFTNNGHGSFSNPRIYNLGLTTNLGSNYPAVIKVADMNGDGNPDIVAPYGIPSDGASISFSIAFGSKAGAFSAPVITSDMMGGGPEGNTFIASGDFNNDGVPDIARLNIPTCTGCNPSVSVFTGSGQGYLNAGNSFAEGVLYGTIVVGDVNGDGKPDIVITRVQPPGGQPAGEDDVSVLLGKGDGTFQPAISKHLLGAPAAGTTNTQTYLADVNHDGKLDLIGDWGVALGNGNGAFQAPIPLPSTIRSISSIALADLNHDGHPDLVVTQSGSGATTTLYILLGNGTGKYLITSQESPQYSPLVPTAILADFNGDGYPDLAYIDAHNGVMVQLGKGNGTFNPGTLVSIPIIWNQNLFPPTLVAADFNRDGHTDLLILGASFTKGDIALLLGSSTGEFTAPPQYYLGYVTSGIAVNLNSDDAPDIAGNVSAGISRMLNTGYRP